MTLVDRFSAGLDEMKRKDQRDIVKVLQVLERIKRFSVFEASENSAIANTMTRIMQEGYAKSVGGAFPWTEVEITDKGRAAIAEKQSGPVSWEDAQRICDLPQVDEAIRNLLADQTGDNATCLVRAVLEAARPTLMPIAWMTDESKRRLSQGGNAKGAVPVHGEPSATAKIPLYIAKGQAQ